VTRRPKLYVPLSVHFFEDDRVLAAGDGPTLLYIAMCLRAKALGTDGRLSEAQVKRLHRRRWRVEISRLTVLELVVLDRSTDQYVIASWHKHNEAIDVRNARLAADRSRKQDKRPAFQPDSNRNPAGIRPESGTQREVERSRENVSARVPNGRAPHCGDCDPVTRQLDIDGHVARCPRCHPLRNEQS
jgi:hypothetical protein